MRMPKTAIAIFLFGLALLSGAGCSSDEILVADALTFPSPPPDKEFYFGTQDMEDYSGNIDYVAIYLNSDRTVINGGGAVYDEVSSVLTINDGGYYKLSGAIEGGQVVVNAPKAEEVYLNCAGLEITTAMPAAIDLISGQKAYIKFEGATESSFTVSPVAGSAVIRSEIPLTLNGQGQSMFIGYDGIISTHEIMITNGTHIFDVANDGIVSREYIAVTLASLYISAGGDAIRAESKGNGESGFIIWSSGQLNGRCGGDGLSALSDIIVSNGNFYLECGLNRASESNGRGFSAGRLLSVTTGMFSVSSRGECFYGGQKADFYDGHFGLKSEKVAIVASEGARFEMARVTVTDSQGGIKAHEFVTYGGVIDITCSGVGIDLGVDGEAGQALARFVSSADVRIHSGDSALRCAGDILFSSGKLAVCVQAG